MPVSGPGLGTRAVRGGQTPDPATGSILTPIHQTATYVQRRVGEHRGHTYSRASNPTVSALEANLGAIESASPAVCFATGLAAEHALFLSALERGGHVVCAEVCYGGTHRLLRHVLAPLGIGATFVDATDPANIARALTPATGLVFLETPANPTLVLTDIAAACRAVRSSGVPERPPVIAVDNTFLTAVGQRPLDLGADVSVYSTTKHIEGHNATVGGALVSRDEGRLDRLRFVRKTVGSIQAPHDAWLTLRGLKTLPIRLRQHSENAGIVARWLERDPRVGVVHYPGLASFAQHELARRQHTLHGGVLSFTVRGGAGGGDEAGRTLIESLSLISLAESLGAVESLVTHPASMTHGDIPGAERDRLGITDGLVRLSVGLEDPVDLIEDLDRALSIACPGASRPLGRPITA
ncbi:MAG: PLP-dependent transferase [Phycisphaeraceae bacterium]|nr:MAG: PLP-dependent transferase [Phycisphaeraceae bacterium]